MSSGKVRIDGIVVEGEVLDIALVLEQLIYVKGNLDD